MKSPVFPRTARWTFGLLAILGAVGCTDDGSSNDEVGPATESDSTDGSTTNGETEVGDSESASTTTDTSTTDESTTDTSTTDTSTTDESTDTSTTDESTDTSTTGDPDVCGDAMITGDELCDDGINDGAYGGCNADCLSLAGYCGDAMLNGPEACDDANLDLADGCFDDCTIPESCLDILTYDDMATDGTYLILPAGEMVDPFSAYCDMTTDGGGWTLAMRFAPAMGQFHFYSTHWTTETVVNEGVLDPADPSDGKFAAYNLVPGASIRGCLQNPMDQSYGCKPYDLPAMTTLLDLFTTTQVGSDATMKGLYFVEVQAEKLEWLTHQGTTLAQSTVPNPNYVQVGINIDDDQSCYDARVRFGLVLNNEANVVTLNDAAGFGAQAYFTAACDLAPGVDSGWKTAAGFQAGPTSYNTAGQIWIR